MNGLSTWPSGEIASCSAGMIGNHSGERSMRTRLILQGGLGHVGLADVSFSGDPANAAAKNK